MDLRRSIVPSGIAVLGLDKHIASVDRHWFPGVFAAEEEGNPWAEQHPNGGFRAEPGETLEQVLAFKALRSRGCCELTIPARASPGAGQRVQDHAALGRVPLLADRPDFMCSPIR